MSEIVLAADQRIQAIPIQECNEPLIDLKEQVTIAYGPVPECDWTKDDYTKMRRSVYDRLISVQSQLPNQWRVRVYEAYRSRKVQEMLFNETRDKLLKQLPDKSADEIYHEVTKQVAPIENLDGSVFVSPHNTGGAVDVELIDQEGKLVNMGMVLKDWQAIDERLFYTDCALIDEEAKENRQMLLGLMEAHDFVNYPTEWWHYSYGDRYWAYHKEKRCAIYGAARG